MKRKDSSLYVLVSFKAAFVSDRCWHKVCRWSYWLPDVTQIFAIIFSHQLENHPLYFTTEYAFSSDKFSLLCGFAIGIQYQVLGKFELFCEFEVVHSLNAALYLGKKVWACLWRLQHVLCGGIEWVSQGFTLLSLTWLTFFLPVHYPQSICKIWQGLRARHDVTPVECECLPEKRAAKDLCVTQDESKN